MNAGKAPEAEKSKYDLCLSSWGFREDPFGEQYPYQERFWARPKEQLDFTEFVLDDAKAGRKCLNILLKGDYGSGKTYMLHVLQNIIRKKYNGLALLFQIPSKNSIRGFRDILSQIVLQTDIENIAEIGKKLAKESGLDSHQKMVTFLSDRLRNSDVATALSNLVFEKEYALTSTWLSGEANLFQVRALGLRSSSRDENTALGIIADLLTFLGFQYPMIAILIDELENLVGESGPIRSVREGLRNLYDEIIYSKQSCSVVMLTAATGQVLYQIEQAMGRALLERIDQVIELAPLNQQETRDFVLEIFNWARKDSKLIDKSSPPFKDSAAFDDFIKLLPEVFVVTLDRESGAKGSPRRMLKNGKHLFLKACFKGIKAISSSDVSEILVKKE